jgi:hypothetical protein
VADVHVRWIGITDGKKLARLGDTLVTARARVEVTRPDGLPDWSADFEIQDGIPECTGIQWKQKPGGRGIRTADLQQVTSLDGLAQNAFLRNPHARRVDKPGWLWDGADVDPQKRDFWAASGDVQESLARRSRGPSQSELEEVARIYRQHVDHAPTAAVQSWFGFSRRTAARRIQQARAIGLLPPTTTGRKQA